MGSDVQLYVPEAVRAEDDASIESIEHVWGTRSYGDDLWIDVNVPYFGPDLAGGPSALYLRGHWPTLRALLLRVRAIAPSVRYGAVGDEMQLLANDALRVTDALIEALDALWAREGWSECRRCPFTYKHAPVTPPHEVRPNALWPLAACAGGGLPPSVRKIHCRSVRGPGVDRITFSTGPSRRIAVHGMTRDFAANCPLTFELPEGCTVEEVPDGAPTPEDVYVFWVGR